MKRRLYTERKTMVNLKKKKKMTIIFVVYRIYDFHNISTGQTIFVRYRNALIICFFFYFYYYRQYSNDSAVHMPLENAVLYISFIRHC